MSSDDLTREEAAARAALIGDAAYAIHLDLRRDDSFTSTTTVTFRCAEPGAASFIDVAALVVESATLNGEDLSTDGYDGARLTLAGLSADNELVVRARHAYNREGKGLHRFVDPVDGRPYLHTQFEPRDAHLVYACFDQPDLKATFDFSVDAPDDWVVVSNMAAREAGPGHWSFATSPRMSTYVTAVVAGPYVSVHDRHGPIDLGIYCRQSLREHLDPDEIFEQTKQGFDFFERAFGMAYPFGKYDQLFVPEFSAGAMENVGCVTFLESYIFRGRVTESARERRCETILHEMAHMWFGDLVTMRWWDDLWLNESFATYMASHAQVHATRFTEAWVTFSDRWKAWAKRQDQLPTTHPIVADVPDVESVFQNFDGITYAKGASVLRQLVAFVGEDAFFEGCRRYFDRNAYGNATLADFLAALEETSGRDLGSWAGDWLETAGLNTLRAEVEAEDGRITSFDIVQTAPDDHPTLRQHRIRVGLYRTGGDGLEREESVELDVDGARTPVEQLVGKPVADLVLVNDDDLAYAKLHLDPESLRNVGERLRDLRDPMARALVWGSVWDMLRDGELPARRYVALVHANVDGEREIGVLETLLARERTATELYGAPENRQRLLRTVADFAEARARAAEPASDAQLAWARHWAAVCEDPDHAARIEALLAGGLVLDGLVLDTELRWTLLAGLAARGHVAPERIEEMLASDPTDIGRRHALAAHASRPEPEAKDEAFQRLVDDQDLSHLELRAIAGGFNRSDQAHLLTPFVDRYFEALPKVWETRALDTALDFAEETFPFAASSEAVLAKLLDAARHLPRPAARTLLEHSDIVRRVIAARACDAGATE